MRAKAGDRVAFEALVDRFLPKVRAFLYRLSGARVDPDDLAQEVFLVIVRTLPALREPGHVSSWIFGIAYRLYQTRNRKLSIQATALDENVILNNTFDPRSNALSREERAAVEMAIARLDERQREVFLLRHLEELSAVEVARILEIPEGSVRRIDFEARERLRELLSAAMEEK